MPINATRGTLLSLPDGEYQGQCANRLVHFRIHTVESGPLAGQRIVKRLENRAWKGFATLRINAENMGFTDIYVWRSMANNLRPGEEVGVNRFLRIWFHRIGSYRHAPAPEIDDLIIDIAPETPFAVRTRTEPRNTNPNPYVIRGVEDVRWRDGSRVTRTSTPAMSFWTPSEVR